LNSLKDSLNDATEAYFRDHPEQLQKIKTAVESSIVKLKEKNG
jgi:hypothetical protein